MGIGEAEHIETEAKAGESDAGEQKRERFRSTIEFPYSDLGHAIEIARIINIKAGVECETAQLAAWLNQTVKSGTFRSRYSAARMFGLIKTEWGGRVKLTDVGRDILSPHKTDRAKVQAFLKVELFRNLYETHKGHELPPPAALKRMVGNFGVAPKQAERARQTFIKSAQVAKFIDQQSGIFIEPAFPTTGEPDPEGAPDEIDHRSKKGGGDDNGSLPPTLDPIIKGLIDRLPEAGKSWPPKDRKLWLGILESAFELVYKDEEVPNEHVAKDDSFEKTGSESLLEEDPSPGPGSVNWSNHLKK